MQNRKVRFNWVPHNSLPFQYRAPEKTVPLQIPWPAISTKVELYFSCLSLENL